MAGVCAFVDSIADNPDTRFDFNEDPVTVLRDGTNTGSAPLQQSSSSSLLTNGGVVGASVYGLRTITLALSIQAESVDDAVDAIAAMNRELDRETNLLMWQPDGLSFPVFYETFRSQVVDIDTLNLGAGLQRVTVRILAKPLGKGVREDLPQATFANACTGTDIMVSLGPVLGDVATPLIAWAAREPDANADWYIVRSDRAPVLFEVDSWTNGGSCSNITGDATYSNSAGKSISFSPDPTADGLGASVSGLTQAMSGTYRVIARVKFSVGTDTITLRSYSGSNVLDTGDVTLPTGSTSLRTVDLGLVTIGSVAAGGTTALTTEITAMAFETKRLAGSGTLGVDWIAYIPAGDDTESAVVHADAAATTVVIDGITDSEYFINAASPFTAGADLESFEPTRTGRYPMLKTNVTAQYVVFIRLGVAALTETTLLDSSYYPLYLNVRPSTL